MRHPSIDERGDALVFEALDPDGIGDLTLCTFFDRRESRRRTLENECLRAHGARGHGMQGDAPSH